VTLSLRPLAVEALSVRNFRNLARVDLELGPRLNVVYGENGQGKTNLLESMYVLGTSRSFRTARQAEQIAIGSSLASVRGRVREGGQLREQAIGLQERGRSVRVDDKRPATLSAYAVWTPMVVFHPGAISLSSGSGVERRRLLDRAALYMLPSSQGEREGYARASRARQRVLETRGERATDLDSWEHLMIQHGLALSAARKLAAEALSGPVENAFATIAGASPLLQVRYERGAPEEPEAFRAELARNRSRDRARRSATVGPHRDDLALELDRVPVRGMASQGQHRAVVIALELAEIEVIERARGVRPVLLLDDVSSELDQTRTRALFAALRREDGQVLLTTTRRELIDTEGLGADDERRDFRAVGGQILPG
jgi:DNA replication and repair protein RecF